jgi:hypothetical protein
MIVKALIPYHFQYRRSYCVACINITLTSQVYQKRRDLFLSSNKRADLNFAHNLFGTLLSLALLQN